MKTHFNHSFFIVSFLVWCFSCQQSISYEISSLGSLQKDENGNCQIIIAGTYISGQNVGDSNNLEVLVNVTSPGSFIITTDTVNGYSFKASGMFNSNGAVRVKLFAAGNPMIADTDHFTVRYNGSFCNAVVPVISDNLTSAAISFDGAPGNCMNDTVYGSYAKGISLDTNAKIKLVVNVTSPGAYNITTNAVNGYRFSASGIFSAAGIQTVFLAASGTPLNTGSDIFTIIADNSSCNFSVNVLSAVTVNNNDYFPLTDNSYWTYDDLLHPGDSIKKTITDTISLNAILYKVMREDVMFGGPYNYFFRKSGLDYLEYAAPNKFTTFFQYKNPVYADIPFLEENLTTGAIWSSPEYIDTATDGNIFTIRYDFTCSNAKATVTLNEKAFTNVYQINMLPLLRLAGNDFEYTGEAYLFYYAKGIGLIYMKKSLSGFVQAELQIRNWKVN